MPKKNDNTPKEEKKIDQPQIVEETFPQLTQEEVLTQKLQEEHDKYLRLAAEYENFRKRSQKEREAIYPDATVAAVTAILSVADNLERAIAMECSDVEYKKGIEMIFSNLQSGFEKLKVEGFGSVGDTFDPNQHTAIMHVEEEGIDTQAIVEVFQRGYKMGERIIRFAMVKVAN